MGTIGWRGRARPVKREQHEALVEKCQENGWLKCGICDSEDEVVEKRVFDERPRRIKALARASCAP